MTRRCLILWWKVLSLGKIGPVSYTHLDVYKRQQKKMESFILTQRSRMTGWHSLWRIADQDLSLIHICIYTERAEPCQFCSRIVPIICPIVRKMILALGRTAPACLNCPSVSYTHLIAASGRKVAHGNHLAFQIVISAVRQMWIVHGVFALRFHAARGGR